ncbi:hypothetical protein BE21_57560 [Sorangium cellulosum]|uniref:Terminase n=1 Tax=Sorangium cellulosum TaxID=56 RepID=A0A150U3C0_SORCE|nr:hypothetical protein BE21_57560 [Sorangium cellulosum]
MLHARLAEAELAARYQAERLSFHEFLTSPEYAGPYMAGSPASPAIQAIALASEGLDIPRKLISDAEVQALFRCARSDLVGINPKVIEVGAGRRGGKTANLLAPKCVHAAWTTPVPNLKPGEIARSVIISPDTDQSGACFNYCQGIVESSPVLSRAIVKTTTEEIVLRRPDGKMVEIVVGAASRGGKAARSRSVVFAGLDEAAFFYPEGSHVANDKDIYDAVLGTIKFLEFAQVWIVSTPWIEGVGVMEEIIEEHWGNPGFALVAARVSSYTLRGIKDDGSLRGGMEEDAYRREILAQPLPAGSASFFDVARVIEAQSRHIPGSASRQERGAGADLGFLKDSSALAISSRHDGGMFSVDRIDTYSPTLGEPLKPSVVCNEFADVLTAEHLHEVVSDQHEKATALEHFGARNITVISAPSERGAKEASYRAVRTLFNEGRLSLSGLPETTRSALRESLRSIVAKPRPGGGYEIIAPRSNLKDPTKIGRARGHADDVSAMVLSLVRCGADNPALWVEAPPQPAQFADAASWDEAGRADWRTDGGGRWDWR